MVLKQSNDKVKGEIQRKLYLKQNLHFNPQNAEVKEEIQKEATSEAKSAFQSSR